MMRFFFEKLWFKSILEKISEKKCLIVIACGQKLVLRSPNKPILNFFEAFNRFFLVLPK